MILGRKHSFFPFINPLLSIFLIIWSRDLLEGVQIKIFLLLIDVLKNSAATIPMRVSVFPQPGGP